MDIDTPDGINTIEEQDSRSQSPIPEQCSICYTFPPVNALRLECGHMFCFSCIKSAAETSNLCSLCRHPIRADFFVTHHDVIGPLRLPTRTYDGKYWLYSGYQGWWLFNAEVSSKLEDAYKNNQLQCSIFTAGHWFRVDFPTMLQQQEGDPEATVRTVARAGLDIGEIKGIGGLRLKDFDSILEMMKSSI